MTLQPNQYTAMPVPSAMFACQRHLNSDSTNCALQVAAVPQDATAVARAASDVDDIRWVPVSSLRQHHGKCPCSKSWPRQMHLVVYGRQCLDLHVKHLGYLLGIGADCSDMQRRFQSVTGHFHSQLR